MQVGHICSGTAMTRRKPKRLAQSQRTSASSTPSVVVPPLSDDTLNTSRCIVSPLPASQTSEHQPTASSTRTGKRSLNVTQRVPHAPTSCTRSPDGTAGGIASTLVSKKAAASDTTSTPSSSFSSVSSLRTPRISYSQAAQSVPASKKAKPTNTSTLPSISRPLPASPPLTPSPSTVNGNANANAATRVYVLSVLLYRMQYGGLHAVTNKLLRSSYSTSLAQRLNAIATLLSRGTDEEVGLSIAVAAGPLTGNGLSAKIIISSPTTPTISPSTSETKELVNLPATSTPQRREKVDRVTSDLQSDIARKTPDTDQFSVVRNSAKRGVIENFDDTVVEGKEIYTEWNPSSKDPIIFHPASRYTFRQFTQKFFRVIKSAAQFDLPIHAAYFCMSQCAAKVKRRCDTIDKLYVKNASLRSWRPTKDETVKSSLVVVKPVDIQHILMRHRVAENPVPTEPGFVFDKSNAHQWLHGLLDTITEFRTLVDALNSTHCEKNVVIATHLSIKLHSYLSLIPSSLWGIPSLGTALTQCSSSIPREDLNTQVELAETFIPWEGVGIPEHPEACLSFLRSVDSLTAWSTSARSLASSRFAQTPMCWNYSVLQLPHNPPQIQPSMIPAVIKGFVEKLKLGARANEVQVHLGEAWHKYVENSSEPPVSCHCEAGIMASNVINETVALNDEPSVIGVAKKCCQFCWMLRQMMLQNGSHYDLPGPHDLFLPWHPPPLPTNILLALERRALRCLSDMITLQWGIHPTDDIEQFEIDDDMYASYVGYLSLLF